MTVKDVGIKERKFHLLKNESASENFESTYQTSVIIYITSSGQLKMSFSIIFLSILKLFLKNSLDIPFPQSQFASADSSTCKSAH